MVRAKFRVSSVEDFGVSRTINMKAVSPGPGEIGENERYHRYTPFGELKITVDNPAAAVQFMPEEEFYLDFTPVKPHDSDCARHNAPALQPGPCDCSRSAA